MPPTDAAPMRHRGAPTGKRIGVPSSGSGLLGDLRPSLGARSERRRGSVLAVADKEVLLFLAAWHAFLACCLAPSKYPASSLNRSWCADLAMNSRFLGLVVLSISLLTSGG